MMPKLRQLPVIKDGQRCSPIWRFSVLATPSRQIKVAVTRLKPLVKYASLAMAGLIVGASGSWISSAVHSEKRAAQHEKNALVRASASSSSNSSQSSIETGRPLPLELHLQELFAEHDFSNRSTLDLADLLAAFIETDDQLAIISLLSSVTKEEGLAVLKLLKERKIRTSQLLSSLFIIAPREIDKSKEFSDLAMEKGLLSDGVVGAFLNGAYSRFYNTTLLDDQEFSHLLDNDPRFAREHFHRDPAQIKDWFNHTPLPEKDRSSRLERLAYSFPQEVAEIVEENNLSEKQAQRIGKIVVRDMIRPEPKKLLELASQHEFIALGGEDYRQLFASWARRNSQAASSAINEMPKGTHRDLAIAGMIESTLRSDPATSLEWASSIEDSEIKATTLSEIEKIRSQSDE